MKFLIAIVAILVVGTLTEGNVVQPRIINGYNATQGQFPWHVFVTSKHVNGKTIYCNGALISNRTVITAAQCLAGVNSASVLLGTVDRSEPVMTLNSKNFTVHPNYNPSTLANNIGVIQLPMTLTASEIIAPIRLPSRSQSASTFVDAIPILSGFGRLNNTSDLAMNLQFAKVKVIQLNQCQRIYGQTVAGINTLCTTGAQNAVQGACADDFGAPLALKEGDNNTLIGIVSFVANNGCNSGNPTGYTRMGAHLDWIAQRAGIDIRQY